MTWRRDPPRKVGQCLAEGCKRNGWEQPWFGAKRCRSYCQKHAREYDKQAAAQGGAVIIQFADYERDPETGHVRRKAS